MIWLVVLISYFLGSIPFGLLLTRAAGLGDIRRLGSGNIGATNVLRTGNKKLAAVTLLLDALKGAAAVLLAQHFARAPLIAGMAVFLGHLFPVWLGFRGGKGVATGLGVFIGGCFPVGLLACAAWLLAAFALRFSSAAALAAFTVAPPVALLLGHPRFALLALIIGAMVVWRHSANIARLRIGTEPRIGQKT